MKKRWMANINRLLARLANPYRPERHYMRGGKARDATATNARRRQTANHKHRIGHSQPVAAEKPRKGGSAVRRHTENTPV